MYFYLCIFLKFYFARAFPFRNVLGNPPDGYTSDGRLEHTMNRALVWFPCRANKGEIIHYIGQDRSSRARERPFVTAFHSAKIENSEQKILLY